MASPDLIRTAVDTYRSATGLMVIPVDGKSKNPIVPSVNAILARGGLTDDEVNAYFHGNGTAIALACGKASLGLGCIDFDYKGEAIEAWKKLVLASNPALLKKVVVQGTQNGGKHIVFRVEGGDFSTLKLARKAIAVSGPSKHVYQGKEHEAVQVNGRWYINPCLVETRGEGGYFLAAPSPGYKLLQGDFLSIPTLTVAEVQALLDAARELDEWAAIAGAPAAKADKRQRLEGEVLPGDDYNSRASMAALLPAYGWTVTGEIKRGKNGEEMRYWTRPGKSSGISATVFDDRSVYVFSSNAYPLEPSTAYDCFGVYARYEHGGDFAAAKAALESAGIAGVRAEQEDIGALLSWDKEPQPVEIQREDFPLPTLAEWMCPDALREWWFDESERVQNPVEFTASASIACLGGLIGRRLAITPKERDKSFLVVPNLWAMIIGRPSVKKTAALDTAVAPVKKIESDAAFQRQEMAFAWEADLEEVEAELKSTKRKLAPTKDDDRSEADILAAKELYAELRQRQEDILKKAKGERYMTNDATVEAVGEIMSVHDKGLIIVRDELAGLLSETKKQGREGAREFYLQGWTGTGSYNVDRIGRGSVPVKGLCLSILGTIQPGKLMPYVDEALSTGSGKDGFLQRFQLMVWPGNSGEPWEYVDNPSRPELFDRACAIYEQIPKLNPEEWGAAIHSRHDVPCISFDSAAQDVYVRWISGLEQRLTSGELAKYPAFEEHLGKYRSLMPSLALIFHVVDCLTYGKRGPVSEQSARQAAAWCDFLELHAKKVFGAELVGDVVTARHLLEKIKDGYISDGETTREILRHNLSGLNTSSALSNALDLLESHGWVKRVKRPGTKRIEIIAHPSLRRNS